MLIRRESAIGSRPIGRSMGTGKVGLKQGKPWGGPAHTPLQVLVLVRAPGRTRKSSALVI